MAKSRWVDFSKIREQVSMVDVLKHRGLLENLTYRDDSLRGVCPLPAHQEPTNPTAFSVSISKNIFNCFSCKGSGGVLDFVAAMEDCSIREAALSLADSFDVDAGKPPPKKKSDGPRSPEPPPADKPKEEPSTPTNNAPMKFELDLDPKHPYLSERGLTEEAIRKFGVGYCKKGIMKNRVVVGVHNGNGELVAYVGRWPGDSGWPEREGKYKFPPKFFKSLEVFNLHRVLDWLRYDPWPSLLVVEGFFDCMKLWSFDLCPIVALMGSSLSDRQAELITTAVGNAGKVILMFDGDEAGRAGQQQAALKLTPHVFVRTIELAEDLQPEHLTKEQLETLLA